LEGRDNIGERSSRKILGKPVVMTERGWKLFKIVSMGPGGLNISDVQNSISATTLLVTA